jgi:hypothetical protein
MDAIEEIKRARESSQVDIELLSVWLEALAETCRSNEDIKDKLKEIGGISLNYVVPSARITGYFEAATEKSISSGEGEIDSQDVVELTENDLKGIVLCGRDNMTPAVSSGAVKPKLRHRSKVEKLTPIFRILNRELRKK